MSYRAYEVASKTNAAGRRIHAGTELAHLNEAAIGSSEQVHARSAGWERPRTMFGRRLTSLSIFKDLDEASHESIQSLMTYAFLVLRKTPTTPRPSPTAKRYPA